MTALLPTPTPPSWQVDLDPFARERPWLAPLRGCPHPGGSEDVWAFTQAVVAALAADAEFRALGEEDRAVLTWAALTHGLGRPERLRPEEPDLAAAHHPSTAARIARRWLWREGVPFGVRERVVNLVRAQRLVFELVEHPEALRLLCALSLTVRLRTLVVFGRALAAAWEGGERLRERAELCGELARDHGVEEAPFPFPSAHARYTFFAQRRTDPGREVYDDTRGEAWLMCGLPGSGKDRWIAGEAEGREEISLDGLRAELGIAPQAPPGRALEAARERARVCLRAGKPFVWNATNLDRRLRRQPIELFARYGARVRVIYVEVPYAVLRRQNRDRPAPVPEPTLEAMIRRWDVPDPTEAHAITLAVQESP